MQPSDEIKEKLDIVDLIRDYIPVKAAGVNFKARCPFHNEKTPSFVISPDKQIWHCFGCGKGGDIFSFIMEMEGIDFVEALRVLAPKAGVVLRRQDPKITSQRNRVLDALDLTRKYYHKVLLESKSSEPARAYLAKRGLSADTIEEWQLGYSPDAWDMIIKFLKTKGFSENEIFLAGLAIKRDNKPGYYDRFRARIMFPINDINSNVVGFSARVSPEKEAIEKLGKYINSPQTVVYDKSRIIFGLDMAKMEIKKEDLAIIVEGQMDVITAHQHGYKNVIASSGTALTNEQIAIIKRYTSNLALAFDMDDAGSIAAMRGIDAAMRADMNISVVELPEGKDPDDCIRKNPDLWQKALADAKQMMQYYFDKTLAKLNLAEVQDKRQGAKILLPIISRLKNEIEQSHWLKKLSELLDTKEEFLREALEKPRDTEEKTFNESTIKQITPVRKSREEKLSELVLALLIKSPALVEYVLNNLSLEQLVGQENKVIYKNIILYYNNLKNTENDKVSEEQFIDRFSYNSFRQWLLETNQGEQQENQLNTLDRLVLLGDSEYYEYDENQLKEELIRNIAQLKKNYLLGRMKELGRMITQAEKSSDEKSSDEFMKELNALADELHSIDV